MLSSRTWIQLSLWNEYLNLPCFGIIDTEYFVFFVAATCTDGLQNQGETGVDCGGPCDACQTCDDDIQNQGEDGIDCGGPCDACIGMRNKF